MQGIPQRTFKTGHHEASQLLGMSLGFLMQVMWCPGLRFGERPSKLQAALIYLGLQPQTLWSLRALNGLVGDFTAGSLDP